METQITLIVREVLSAWRPVSCNLHIVSHGSLVCRPIPNLDVEKLGMG